MTLLAVSRNGENGYPELVISGTRGYLQDTRYRLSYGRSAVVGRSRKCAISLLRGKKYRAGASGTCLRDADFLRVSRRHLEISYPHRDLIEIRDLSRNGIRVNGKKVNHVILSELPRGACAIEFGGNEEICLAWDGKREGKQ